MDAERRSPGASFTTARAGSQSGSATDAVASELQPKQVQGPVEVAAQRSCSCGRSSSAGSGGESSLAAQLLAPSEQATPRQPRRAGLRGALDSLRSSTDEGTRSDATPRAGSAATRSTSVGQETRATDFDAASSVMIEMGEEEEKKKKPKKAKQKPAWRHNPTAEEETLEPMKECRMCLGIDEQDDIISVCNCSGTQAWMHYGCLKLWVRERKLLTCELCHAPYAEPYMGLLKEELGKYNRREHTHSTLWPDIETGYGAGVLEFGGLARTDPSTWPPTFSRQLSNSGTLSSTPHAEQHRAGDCECQCCECCDCACCHHCDSGAVSAVLAIAGFIIFLIIIAAVGSAAG